MKVRARDSPAGAASPVLQAVAESDDGLVDLSQEVEVRSDRSTMNREPADPARCIVEGMKSGKTYPIGKAEFHITACDSSGGKTTSGGESFFIAIRGASRVRARVGDNGDGTYSVQWKPTVSGAYQIAVSIFGAPLLGSPYKVRVHDASPYAPRCEVRGDALFGITARTPSAFEVHFRDRGGRVTQAVELDLFVEWQPDADAQAEAGDVTASSEGSRPRYPLAWDVATKKEGGSEPEMKPRGGAPGAAGRAGESGDGYSFSETKKSAIGRKKGNSAAAGNAFKSVADEASIDDEDDGMEHAGDAQETYRGTKAARESMRSRKGGGGSARDEDDGGYSSPDELLSAGRSRVRSRRRAIAIRVTSEKPLVVRAAHSLRSERIAYLQPGQQATVIEERITSGDVRALVVFEWKPEKEDKVSARPHRYHIAPHLYPAL